MVGDELQRCGGRFRYRATNRYLDARPAADRAIRRRTFFSGMLSPPRR